jgi:hypothetical protein
MGNDGLKITPEEETRGLFDFPNVSLKHVGLRVGEETYHVYRACNDVS